MLAGLLALVVFAWPRAAGALIYEREKILHGEGWRVVTGHWVHFSISHLFWNLAVLIPAGAWLERLAPGRARWMFLLAPIVIGGALLMFDAELARYGGLSGIAAGMVALLALTQLAKLAADRWFWWGVLVLLGLKIGAELLVHRPLFARFDDAGLQAVPLAHIAGIGCACAIYFTGRSQI